MAHCSHHLLVAGIRLVEFHKTAVPAPVTWALYEVNAQFISQTAHRKIKHADQTISR